MSFLDLFFPKRCVGCRKFGSYLCETCFAYISFTETGICVICQRPAIGGATHPVCRTKYTIDGVFSSLIYTGIVKKLVYTFKYKPYVTDIQETLIDLFYEGIIQKELFMKQMTANSVFVPVPLHKKRMRSRGYNQSLILAKGIGTRFSLPVLDCLERVRDTGTQVGLSQIKRKLNVRDAFQVKKVLQSELIIYKQAFLVDDVSTSGATLSETAKMLKKAGIKKVWGLTLAHGQ